MQPSNLSRKAVDLLGDNGYSFNSKDGKICIKRRSGFMGPVVLLFVTLFLSIPVFSAGTIYGLTLISVVVGAILIRRIYFAKKSSLEIDLNTKTFTAKVGTYFQENQPLGMISEISLNSKFIDEYTTAARNSVEEYLISIAIHLISKEQVTLFEIKSEQSEPTQEINEVYNLLENTVKEAKAS